MQETQETWVWSLNWEYLLGKEMAAHSSILAEKSHGQKSLAVYCPKGHTELDDRTRAQSGMVYFNEIQVEDVWV